MLSEALAVLASAGGTAAVAAMVTDGWTTTRKGLARLLGRDDPERTAEIESGLERDRAELARLTGDELRQARAACEDEWRERIAGLLKSSPESEESVRAWLNAARANSVTQHVVGNDNAQQATLGSGVQNVTFGNRPDA